MRGALWRHNDDAIDRVIEVEKSAYDVPRCKYIKHSVRDGG